MTPLYTDGSTQIQLQFASLNDGNDQLTVASGNPGLRKPGGQVLDDFLDGNADGNGGDEFVAMFVIDTTPPIVAGRHIFYNNSSFDGNDPAINAGDDGAIAPNPDDASMPDLGKTALLPGGIASFRNDTSYSRGINGIMVDIDQLPEASLVDGVLTASDFDFRVGNDNTPGDWLAVQGTAPEVEVRSEVGVDLVDRITIVWEDGQIQNQWIQVTVKGNSRTGLTEDDVFYFGNAVGDTGDSPNNAQVNATDELGSRFNPRNFLNPAGLDDPHGFDRDGRVNGSTPPTS